MFRFPRSFADDFPFRQDVLGLYVRTRPSTEQIFDRSERSRHVFSNPYDSIF